MAVTSGQELALQFGRCAGLDSLRTFITGYTVGIGASSGYPASLYAM
jgi:hypothetical protein